MISDNATTFEDASTTLMILPKDLTVIRYLTDRQVERYFIPKRPPWYRGIYERLMVLIKRGSRRLRPHNTNRGGGSHRRRFQRKANDTTTRALHVFLHPAIVILQNVSPPNYRRNLAKRIIYYDQQLSI